MENTQAKEKAAEWANSISPKYASIQTTEIKWNLAYQSYLRGYQAAQSDWVYVEDGLPDNARKVWIAYTCEGWVKPLTCKGIYSSSMECWYISDNGWAAKSEWQVYAWREIETVEAPPLNPKSES